MLDPAVMSCVTESNETGLERLPVNFNFSFKYYDEKWTATMTGHSLPDEYRIVSVYTRPFIFWHDRARDKGTVSSSLKHTKTC